MSGNNFQKNIALFCLMIFFILTNSVDPDEMQHHYAAFHLGLHCLQKYLLGVSQIQLVKHPLPEITSQNVIISCVLLFISCLHVKYEPRHEISNVVCATSKASDQPAQMPSLIRAFASPLNIL